MHQGSAPQGLCERRASRHDGPTCRRPSGCRGQNPGSVLRLRPPAAERMATDNRCNVESLWQGHGWQHSGPGKERWVRVVRAQEGKWTLMNWKKRWLQWFSTFAAAFGHSWIHAKIASVSCHDIHLQMDVPKILGVLSLGLQVSFCASCRLHRWYPVASNPRATSTWSSQPFELVGKRFKCFILWTRTNTSVNSTSVYRHTRYPWAN